MTEDMNNIEELVDKNEKLIDIWGVELQNLKRNMSKPL